MDPSEPLYVGKVTADGTWMIQRFTNSTSMTYASLSNNPLIPNYQTAWGLRGGLVFSVFNELYPT